MRQAPQSFLRKPNGKYLIFAVTEAGRGRYLRSVPLNLSSVERNRLK